MTCILLYSENISYDKLRTTNNSCMIESQCEQINTEITIVTTVQEVLTLLRCTYNLHYKSHTVV